MCASRCLRRSWRSHEGGSDGACFARRSAIPETVDFTNPMLPPGMNAERIHAGMASQLKGLITRVSSAISPRYVSSHPAFVEEFDP